MTDSRKEARPGDAPPGLQAPAHPQQTGQPSSEQPSPQTKQQSRKALLLRLDPAIHDALAKWAADDLRSLNAHIDFLLRHALAENGRLPNRAAAPRRPGRPKQKPPTGDTSP